jgi:hypothetical protein
MAGLTREAVPWEEMCRGLPASAAFITADALLIADVLVYLASFSAAYHPLVLADWRGLLAIKLIAFARNLSIVDALGNDVKIRDWVLRGLPND